MAKQKMYSNPPRKPLGIMEELKLEGLKKEIIEGLPKEKPTAKPKTDYTIKKAKPGDEVPKQQYT